MKKLVLLLLLVLVLASCSQENTVLTQGDAAPKEVTVRIKAKLNDMVTGLPVSIQNGTSNSTRSVTAIDENKINTLCVLQYNRQTKAYMTSQYLTSTTDFNDFILTLANTTTDNCNIYFVANVGNIASSNSENIFLQSIKSYTTENQLISEGIPMVGLLSNVSVSGGKLPIFSVRLKRLLARVDFTYSVASGITLSSLRVCNVPVGMSYYPPTTLPATPANASPAGVSTNFRNFDYEPTITPGTPKTYYLPVNLQGSDATITEPINKTGAVFPYATYFEIIGGSSTVLREYRYYVGNGVGDYNLEADKYYKVTANLKGTSLTDKRVNAFPESNCYIVAPGSTIYIPVSRALNGFAAAGGTGFDDNSIISVVKLWGSVENPYISTNLVNSGNYIKLKVNSQECNFVIYAFAESKTVWSWHIWVTNYNPSFTANTGTNTATYDNNGLLWMDRNLGATTTTPGLASTKGLLYQWGRKDPFPGSSGVNDLVEPNLFGSYAMSFEEVSVSNNLLNSIRQPLKFYTSNPGSSDWYTPGYSPSTQNNTLWYNGTPTKTIYDPCPVGWRVPFFIGTISPWSNFAPPAPFASYGVMWGGSFYPAAGCRSFTGKNYEVGTQGHYWSASANGVLGAFMGFTNSAVDINKSEGYRSMAKSVRCVKE